MNSEYRRHWYVKVEMSYRMRDSLTKIGSSLYCGAEGTVAMPPNSAPEPDIVVTSEPRGGKDFIPLDSVALAIEVSDSSARFDLKTKAALYAGNGVPEYWVFDIPKRGIRQFWSPSPHGYRDNRETALGGPCTCVTIDGLTVETDGLV